MTPEEKRFFRAELRMYLRHATAYSVMLGEQDKFIEEVVLCWNHWLEAGDEPHLRLTEAKLMAQVNKLVWCDEDVPELDQSSFN